MARFKFKLVVASAKTIWLLVALAACNFPLAAQTFYVGTCKSGSFPTISAAVNSSSVTPGSTIKICAGVYTEQVIISKDLTLQGLDGISNVLESNPGGGSGAILESPGSFEVTFSPVFSNRFLSRIEIAPIIWVTAGTVNIQNVSVLGTGVALPCCATEVGFYYASGASGTLNHVGFLDQAQAPAVGIWAENANNSQTSVTIENSYSYAGIVAGSSVPGKLAVKITGNQVSLAQPEEDSFLILFDGIYVYQVSGTVEANFISERGPADAGDAGIEVDGNAATDVTISGNSIQTTNPWDPGDLVHVEDDWTGIIIDVDGATIKSNKISGAGVGINMGCHAATVSGNTIMLALSAFQNVPKGFTGVNSLFNNMYNNFDSPC